MRNLLNDPTIRHSAIIISGGLKTGAIVGSRPTVAQAERLAKWFETKCGWKRLKVVHEQYLEAVSGRGKTTVLEA